MEALTVEDGILRSLADKICKRGLEGPAVFFLELHKPMLGMIREFASIGSPVFVMLFGEDFSKTLRAMLESQENIERLIQLIETGTSPGR